MYKIFLFVLAFGVVACSPSKKSSSQSGNPNTAQRAGESLAPGTAKIQFSVADQTSTEANQTIWDVTVHEVMGYGSATPPIGSGITMQVDATLFLKYAKNESAYYTDKERIVGIVEARGEQVGGSEGSPQWSLSRILDNE